MNNNYADITDRIGIPPKWWDEHAVPRFCDFHPSAAGNIYAEQVVLMLIACQSCGTEFRVCMSWSVHDLARRIYELEHRVRSLHYGDPPNTSCCDAGGTMNSEPKRVLEFWKRVDLEWVRMEELEIGLQSLDSRLADQS